MVNSLFWLSRYVRKKRTKIDPLLDII